MVTNNILNIPLSGNTGTVNFAGSTGATFITPILGAANATSLTFSSTSGYIGTTANNNAAAGSVGELISATSGGGNLSASGATNNITSIALTAGDWDVCGTVVLSFAAGTTSTLQRCGISSTSATYGTIGEENNTILMVNAITGAQSLVFNLGSMRFSLAAPTTVYLLGSATYAVSTIAYGGFISARRVR